MDRTHASVIRRHFHEDGSHAVEIAVSLMAATGAAARYFNDMYKNKTPFSILRLLLKIVTCVFVGITAWNAAVGFGANQYLSIATSNLSAWFGVEALSFFWDVLQKYINKRV